MQMAKPNLSFGFCPIPIQDIAIVAGQLHLKESAASCSRGFCTEKDHLIGWHLNLRIANVKRR